MHYDIYTLKDQIFLICCLEYETILLNSRKTLFYVQTHVKVVQCSHVGCLISIATAGIYEILCLISIWKAFL